jgi:hypothetical protein
MLDCCGGLPSENITIHWTVVPLYSTGVFRNVKKLPTGASFTAIPLPATNNDPLTNHSIVPDDERQTNPAEPPSKIVTDSRVMISVG